MSGIKFEIKRKIATISENENYTKEINVISWNGGEDKIDLRTWKNAEDGKQPLKGITMTLGEAKALKEALGQI